MTSGRTAKPSGSRPTALHGSRRSTCRTATRRKLTKPVFAYSIAWHPGERPTKAEQLETARSSLEAQGLEEHQALILCHTDEPQAHVHVIVNRVHPVTGK